VTPAQVNTAFAKRWTTALPALEGSAEPRRAVEAVVAMSWLVSTLNRIFEENEVSASLDYTSPRYTFESKKLTLADRLDARCTVTTQCMRGPCTREPCSRPPGKCAWNCQRCVKVWGKRYCTDEPGCKASRHACNVQEEAKVAACNVHEESKKAACNTREEAELAACKARKTTEEAACALVNTTVSSIKEIGDIGRFGGHAQVEAHASIHTPELAYDAGQSSFKLSVRPDAAAVLRGALSFKPYDIGHILVCAAPGSIPFRVNAELIAERLSVAAQISPTSSASGSLRLKLTFDPLTLRGKLSPSPIDALLTNNPQLFVMCNPVLTGLPTAANVLGKISAYTSLDVLTALERAVPGNQVEALNLVRALTSGDMQQTVAIQPFQIDVPPLPIKNGTINVILVPVWRDGHILYGVP
jgi:hypothetical protein